MWKVWTATVEDGVKPVKAASFCAYESALEYAETLWESMVNWDSVAVLVAESLEEAHAKWVRTWEDDPCVRCFERFGACAC